MITWPRAACRDGASASLEELIHNLGALGQGRPDLMPVDALAALTCFYDTSALPRFGLPRTLPD